VHILTMADRKGLFQTPYQTFQTSYHTYPHLSNTLYGAYITQIIVYQILKKITNLPQNKLKLFDMFYISREKIVFLLVVILGEFGIIS